MYIEDEDDGEEIRAAFEKHDDEFLKFDRVVNKLSNRPDLHCFLVLDWMFPGTTDMIDAAEHDEIYLEPNALEFLRKVTEEQLIDLIRCGLRYDESIDSLCMFA